MVSEICVLFRSDPTTLCWPPLSQLQWLASPPNKYLQDKFKKGNLSDGRRLDWCVSRKQVNKMNVALIDKTKKDAILAVFWGYQVIYYQVEIKTLLKYLIINGLLSKRQWYRSWQNYSIVAWSTAVFWWIHVIDCPESSLSPGVSQIWICPYDQSWHPAVLWPFRPLHYSICLHFVNDTFKTPSTNRLTEVSWYLLLCSTHLSGVPSLLKNYNPVQLIFVAWGERDERMRYGLKVSLFLDDTLSVAIKSVHIDILNGLKGNTLLNISANASLWSRYFTSRMDDHGRV